MIKMFSDAKAAMLLHKLAILRFLLFSFGSLATAAQTALAGMDWVNSDTQTQLMVVVGILASWSIAMMAFLDRTMARIAQGEIPFGEDNQKTVPTGTQTTQP
jgi:hypothetical protein